MDFLVYMHTTYTFFYLFQLRKYSVYIENKRAHKRHTLSSCICERDQYNYRRIIRDPLSYHHNHKHHDIINNMCMIHLWENDTRVSKRHQWRSCCCEKNNSSYADWVEPAGEGFLWTGKVHRLILVEGDGEIRNGTEQDFEVFCGAFVYG